MRAAWRTLLFSLMRVLLKIFTLGLCLISFTLMRAAVNTHSHTAEGLHHNHCVLTDEHSGGEALFTDSSELFRVCGQRSNRLANAGSTAKRTAQRLAITYNNLSKFVGHYGRFFSRLTSAMMPMPQSDYYVFALRRLLC